MNESIFPAKYACDRFGTNYASWLRSLSQIRVQGALSVSKSKSKTALKKSTKTKANGKAAAKKVNGAKAITTNGTSAGGKSQRKVNGTSKIEFEEDPKVNGKPAKKPAAKKEEKVYDDQSRTSEAIDDPVRMYLMQMGEIP